MSDTEHTLTSPLSVMDQGANPLLGLTIIWHPDRARIGEQFIGGTQAGMLELGRFLPLFRQPGGEGLALGHSSVSRDPLRILRDADNGVRLELPNSRMVVELNGEEIQETQYLCADDIEAGQILGLGRTVLLCLHWMRCLPKNNPVTNLLGVGSAAIVARDQIKQVAGTDLPVLLLGETGTGKEIAARAIHALSLRSNAPLVTVNMAALNESLAAADLFGAVKGAYTGAQTARKGLFAEADQATLFLDEIGNTPASVQPMLLRVLEGGDYRPLGAHKDLHASARIIAATDQDLESDNFNQALLRRLESFVIHLPPLRLRREDIGVLIKHLLSTNTLFEHAQLAFPTSLVTELASYDWPGNVRQLNHVMKRAMLALQIGDTPTLSSLINIAPERISQSSQLKAYPSSAQANSAESTKASSANSSYKKPAELNEEAILRAMENNDWYIQAAAQELGISRPSMYKLLAAHSQIRRAEKIPLEEIHQALSTSANNVAHCAALLKTPSEALRRYLRGMGLLA
jgi:two-component system nitrogen regulation response regulator GlnG